ncbi:HAAS signaling domain-containing protein [Longispora urticae]
MSTTTSGEAYLAGVRAALSDLPPEVRDDLMEDLPAHLADIEAEHSGTLTERLGTPAEYAAELRAAAGLDPAGNGHATSLDWRRFAAFLSRVDVRLGTLVGYPRIMDLFLALRPAWWIFRGWVIASFLMLVFTGGGPGLLPFGGGNGQPLLGLLVLLGSVAFSVWLGRRTRTTRGWPRWLLLAAAFPIALVGLVIVAESADRNAPYNSYDRWGHVQDIVAYDAEGRPLKDVRIYDQNGDPIQMGNPYRCRQSVVYSDGDSFGRPDRWIYPLCPQDQQGPGPIQRSGAPQNPRPSATPSVAPSASPGATPTPATSASPSAVP